MHSTLVLAYHDGAQQMQDETGAQHLQDETGAQHLSISVS